MSVSTDVANIGPEQQRRRRVAGGWTLAIALLIATASWLLEWGSLARLASAPLFFSGFLGIFQARERTCVALASRGMCDLDTGPRAMEDPDQMRSVRVKANRVLMKSLAAAVVATLIVLLLP